MIDRLEMFIALAQERHFGRAAARLGMAQPSLSSALKGLEESFGVQLVRRGSRFQGLTPEGENLYARALELVADARALREEMRALRHGLSGDLRLGAIPTAMPMVADLTAPFAARHPGVRLSILSRSSTEILAQIEDQQLDAGLTYLDEEARRRCDCLRLYDERYALLVAAGDPLAARARLSWEELRGQPLCLLTRDMQNRRIVDRNLAGAGAGAVPMIESNSHVALMGHVMTGRWVSIVPEKFARLFAADRAVAAVPIVGGGTEAVGLAMARRELHVPALAALIEMARKLSA